MGLGDWEGAIGVAIGLGCVGVQEQGLFSRGVWWSL